MSYIDPVKVSPEYYKPLLEDGRVRVLDMRLPAGKKDAQHSHPNEVVFFVKGGSARIHLPDGKSVDAQIPDGHVMSNEAWTHTVENTGNSDIRAIIVEMKS